MLLPEKPEELCTGFCPAIENGGFVALEELPFDLSAMALETLPTAALLITPTPVETVPAPMGVDFLAPLAPPSGADRGAVGAPEAPLPLEVKRTLLEPLDPEARTPLGLTFCLTTATISAADNPIGSGDPLEIGDDPATDKSPVPDSLC